MDSQFRLNFPHRLNPNGFYDSICTTCHLTIASARSEAQLELLEGEHRCSPIRLYLLSEDRLHGQSRPQSY
jgi:hypothetical protein